MASPTLVSNQPWQQIIHAVLEEMAGFRLPDGTLPHEASGQKLKEIQAMPAREFPVVLGPLGAKGESLAVKVTLDPSPAPGRESRLEVDIPTGKNGRTKIKRVPFAMSVTGDPRRAAQEIQRLLGIDVVDQPASETTEFLVAKIVAEARSLKERVLRDWYGSSADIAAINDGEKLAVFQSIKTHEFRIALRECDPFSKEMDILVSLRLDMEGSRLTLVYKETGAVVKGFESKYFNYLPKSVTKAVESLVSDLQQRASRTAVNDNDVTASGIRRKLRDTTIRPSPSVSVRR